jgi:hypothetical protein
MGEVMSGAFLGEGPIWVEVLGRHGDVVSRQRFTSTPITVGRAYDNDVVVDDPHVAAHHLRIERSDEGVLRAEDLGGRNGLYLGRGRDKRSEIALDGDHELSIGATMLRVRTASFSVPDEQPVIRGLRFWPAAIACIAGVFLLAVLDLWLSDTTEPKAIRYFTPLLIIAGIVVVWTTGWSVITRVFRGHARFGLHFLVVAAGMLAFSFYDQAAEMGAFAFSWTALTTTSYLIAWILLGAVVFAHLLAINPSRKPIKLGIAILIAAAGIAMQTLRQGEFRSNYGQPVVLSRLEPPALRLVAPQHDAVFFTDAAKLRTSLDKERTEEPSAGDVFSEDSDD